MVVLVCAAAVFALTRPGDVFDPNVEFQAEEEPTSVPTPAPEPPAKGKKGKKKDPLAGFKWPTNGYTNDRRRFLQTEPSVRPPFKIAWSRRFDVLLEFPPIIVGNRLYTVGNAGVIVAMNKHDRQARLAARRGLPRRLLPRLRRRADLRDDPRALQGRAEPAGSSP